MKASPCSCLAAMYLSTANLQAIEPYSFPFALKPIKTAMLSANEILNCQSCPKSELSGGQNILLLNTLMIGILHALDLLLRSIDAEAAEMRQRGMTKAMSVADNSLENIHRHTHDFDCPARVDTEMSADEWQPFARRIVSSEIFGASSPKITAEKLAVQFTERQRVLHGRRHQVEVGASANDNDQLCVRMTQVGSSCLTSASPR